MLLKKFLYIYQEFLERSIPMSTQAIPQVHIKLTEWQNKHETNITAANNLINNYETQFQNGEINENELKAAAGSVWDAYEEETAKLGYGFNFMEGNDTSNSEAYQAQLGKLAQGDMLSKDKNGDGKISRNEYILGEVYGGSTALSKEQKAQAAAMASMMFDAIDSLVLTNSNPDDDNIDGNLSSSDIENLYKVLDGFNYNDDGSKMSFDGNFNGELDIDSFNAFMETATASVTEEQQKALENYYLGIFDSVEKMTTKEA